MMDQGRSDGEWHDLRFDLRTGFCSRLAEVEFLLESNPEFSAGSEVAAEVECGIRGDRPAATDDGGHTAVGDFQIHGKTVSGDFHRFEKLGLKDFAGMGET